MQLDKERLRVLFMELITTATEPMAQSATMWDVVLSSVAYSLSLIADETIQMTNIAGIEAALIVSRHRPDGLAVFRDIIGLTHTDEAKLNSLLGKDDLVHFLSHRVASSLGNKTKDVFEGVAARQLAQATPQSRRKYKYSG